MVFVQKSDFFSFGFFGMIKSEKIFYHILDRKERVLDPKINVLKSAKNRHYRKGGDALFLFKNRTSFHLVSLV